MKNMSSSHNERNAQPPLISVITVVFNARDLIEKTIQSVIHQSYSRCEYIVIDGGSSDGTQNILTQYNENIKCCISEADKGIYDAMNKGVKYANGDLVIFINAGDWLEPNALEIVAGHYSSNIDFIATSVRDFNDALQESGILQPKPLETAKRIMLRSSPFPHPGLYVKRSVFNEVCGFDLRYKIVADKDFIVKLLRASSRGVILKDITANFVRGGVSGTMACYREDKLLALNYGVSSLTANYWLLVDLCMNFLVRIIPLKPLRMIRRFRRQRREKKLADL